MKYFMCLLSALIVAACAFGQPSAKAEWSKVLGEKRVCQCVNGGECICGPDGCNCLPTGNVCRQNPDGTWTCGPKKPTVTEYRQQAPVQVAQAPVRKWSQGGVVYDVPVFYQGVMYGTPVSDPSLLGPPPPDIVGAPVIINAVSPAPARYVAPAVTGYYLAPAPAAGYTQYSTYQRGGLFGQKQTSTCTTCVGY